MDGIPGPIFIRLQAIQLAVQAGPDKPTDQIVQRAKAYEQFMTGLPTTGTQTPRIVTG